MGGSEIIIYDLTKKERELALGYIVSILLKSRISSGLSHPEKSRDDVDVYVANLLLSLTDPKVQERNQKYLFFSDADVVQKIEYCPDTFIKYLIYKTNADNIIISLSLFDQFKLRDKHGRLVSRRKFQAYQGRGRIYYELASTYHHKVYRRQTGICDALDKLSEHFEEYLEVMRCMKTEFFSFIDHVSDTKFHAFKQNLKEYANTLAIKEKTDQFLDAYNQWKKNPTLEHRHLLKQVVHEMESINPYFQFDIKKILP